MRLYKAIALAVSCFLFVGMMTGCSSNDPEIAKLRSIEALNTESELQNINMSVTEKEAAIYAQISNRTLLDLSSLTTLSDNDKELVTSYMDSVDAQLCGTVSAEDGVIKKEFTDYLLMEFEKTPYYWQRKSMNIRGMDTTSRSIVIDVTYHTVDFKKDVKPNSPIILGEPQYETLMKNRYDRYIQLLQQKEDLAYNENEAAQYAEDLKTFESTYGSIDSILKSQRKLSLTDNIFETGNQITYSGMIDNEQEQVGATMTVRFILTPLYTYGINQGYTCKHLYMLNYQVDKDLTEGRSLYEDEESATIVNNVYSTLMRYYKCLDEDNYSGVYKLNNAMPNMDKYFEDYFNTTYRKYDSFTLSIFDIKNTRIECGATVSRKVRTKGSEMALPIYTDRYYYVLELLDGELKITQEVLLSSAIEGEPAISTEEVEVTGFTSSLNLSNDDRKALEGLIAAFGAQQLLGDSTSDTFADLVDMSLSASQVDAIRETMLSVTGQTKATWILSYLQGTDNYASIKCRELVQSDTSSVTELITTYSFIHKGGKWLIYDYQIGQRVKLDSSSFNTANSLCVVTAGSVDMLVSQVEDSNSEGEDSEQSNSNSNSGEVTDFNEYRPVTKGSNVTQQEVPESTTEEVADVTTEESIEDMTDFSEDSTVSDLQDLT